MHRGTLASVTRLLTAYRCPLHLPQLSRAVLISAIRLTTSPFPIGHSLRSLAMSAAAPSHTASHSGAANGVTSERSSDPRTPVDPPSPDDLEAVATSSHSSNGTAEAGPGHSSTPPLSSNSSGGTSSSFLHSLASRLQGKRGEQAGRALSAPANPSPHHTSHSSASAGFDLSKLQQPSLSPARPLVVLLACGSYSPITNMHLLLFETAKNYLMYETGALDVVGGVISPVHDSYGKPSLVAAPHRIAMTRAATASSPWIATSAWETLQAGWTTTCATMVAYSQLLAAAALYPQPPRLVLLCGADLLESTQVPGLWAPEDLEAILGQYGVAVIERVGLDLERLIAGDERLRRWRQNIWIVPQRVVNNVSSTVVRNMIRDGLSIEYLVEARVRQYIDQHALFGHDREREKRRQQRPVGRPATLVEADKRLEEEVVEGAGEAEREVSADSVDGDDRVAADLTPEQAHAQRNNQT